MPETQNNIASVTITDAEMLERFPILNRYLADDQSDWSSARASGAADALEAFRSMKGQKPERAVAEDADDWRRILAMFSLSAAFAGMAPREDFRETAEFWRAEAKASVERFVYRYDSDSSGTLSDAAEESASSGRSVRVVR